MFARLQNLVTRPFRRFDRDRWIVRRLRLRESGGAEHPRGLLLVQIDGLARTQFERALAAGRMPFLKRLLEREDYGLHTFYSGLPASTPAVQGELHYGVRTAVPAFAFLERERGSMAVMMTPTAAVRTEAKLAASGRGLLEGGSSWSNIYTGGATQAESHFCAASIGLGDMWRTGKLRTIFTFVFVQTSTSFRLAGLLALELALALRDAAHGTLRQGRSLWRECKFLVARVFVCAGLRELVTLGGSVDVSRGLPIVHVNFLGYDEQSHRRGPGSAFAHWTLKGIDRSIRRLHRAAVRSEKRQYDVWVFSDHGQTASRQFAKSHDGGLEGLVRRLLPDFDPSAPRLRLRSQETPSPVRTLRSRTSKRAAARDEASATLATGERDGIAVACMGPVGHVYFTKALGDDARRLLAARLVAEGVPGVLLRRDDGRADWLTRDGTHLLPDHAEMLPHPAELRAEIAADMVALAAHPDAGDVVALGFSLEGDHCTFASENGAHAGPSPDEVQGFALLPERIRLPDTAHRFIRPTMLREAAMEFLGRDERVNARRAPHRRRNTTPSAPSLPLRVATYNAHGCLGTDGILSPRRIADVLDMLDADIVAVQELDVGRARSSGVDQPAFLADALGMHHVFSPSIDGENGAYGHALLSRTPFVSTHSLRLPLGRNHLAEPRSVLVARMRWAERELVVIATHLGLGRNERERQVEYVLRECLPPAAEDVPVVVCGDLNLVPGAPAFVRLSRDLQDAQRVAPGWKCRATFPSLLPVRRLDHILVSAHFEVRAAKILGDSLARRASDHLPLAADLALRVIKQEALPRPPACASTPFG